MKIREFEFSVPWGLIAVKAWGDEKDPMVLVMHGITDNACTFDRLIPLLPRGFYYACIELPGHGKSTQFPSYLPLITINYFMVYLYIMNYFGRNNYIIIGHSYGGQLGQLVAQLYPERVSKLVMLDTLHLWWVPAENYGDYLKSRLNLFMTLQRKLDSDNPPLYTYEEALNRIITGRSGAIKEECAKNLLKRHLTPVGDKFKFTQDPRLKFFINPLHDDEYILKTFEHYPLQCPVLIILALGTKIERLSSDKLYEKLRSQKNVTIIKVDGNHDVHNNEPELVAPHITKFLLETKNKL